MGGVDALQVFEEKDGIDGKRVSAHQCRLYMVTTQLAMGCSPLDVLRQMGHMMLTMKNYYVSLATHHLQKLHEKYSSLRAVKGVSEERRLVRVIGVINYVSLRV